MNEKELKELTIEIAKVYTAEVIRDKKYSVEEVASIFTNAFKIALKEVEKDFNMTKAPESKTILPSYIGHAEESERKSEATRIAEQLDAGILPPYRRQNEKIDGKLDAERITKYLNEGKLPPLRSCEKIPVGGLSSYPSHSRCKKQRKGLAIL